MAWTLFGRRPKIQQRETPEAPDQDTFSKAATSYLSGKGFAESSMEAVRRAAKANRLRPRVNIGQHPGEI